MCVELCFVGQDLLTHELRGSLTEQALLIAEVIAREEKVRIQGPNQERSATRHFLYRRHGSSRLIR